MCMCFVRFNFADQLMNMLSRSASRIEVLLCSVIWSWLQPESGKHGHWVSGGCRRTRPVCLSPTIKLALWATRSLWTCGILGIRLLQERERTLCYNKTMKDDHPILIPTTGNLQVSDLVLCSASVRWKCGSLRPLKILRITYTRHVVRCKYL